MGLEAGWNCHISLASDATSVANDEINEGKPRWISNELFIKVLRQYWILLDSNERRKSVMLHLKAQERRKSFSQHRFDMLFSV